MNQPATYIPNQSPDKLYLQPMPASRPDVATTQPVSTERWTVKERIMYSFLGLVAVGGTVWLGRKIYRELVSNKEENKSFEDGTPATIAKQIKMAFENDGWWGTDTKALRTTLRSVDSQATWNKVIISYEKLYSTPAKKANLLRDLSDELQTTEYEEMMQIINAKPEKPGQAPNKNQYSAWAKRLKAAFDKTYGFLPGTDEAALVAVLNEIPTQSAFIQVGVSYKKQFSTNLLDDLKSESEFGKYYDWMKIITEKKK